MDADDVYATSDNLRDKIETIFKNAGKSKNLSTSIKGILTQLNALDMRAESVTKRLNDLAQTDVPTDQYKEVREAWEKAVGAREAAKERMNKFLATGGKQFTKGGQVSRTFAAIQYDIQKADQEAKALEAELNRLANVGRDFIPGVDTEEYQQLSEELNQINNRITVYNAKLRETAEGRALLQEEAKWSNLAQGIGRAIALLFKVPFKVVVAGLTGIAHGLKKVASLALTAAKNLARVAGNTIKRGLSKLGSSLFGLGRSTETTNDMFKKGFRTLIRYGFGVRSLFFLIKRLRTLLIKGLEGLGEAYAPFGQTIQSFKNALNELKGSFVSAFAPIASTVIPILNALMSAITAVLNRLAMLFAALRGQTSYLKAKVVPATQAAGSAASGAADATEKYKKTLAGFDDVEILQAPDSKGSGGGGSSGTGSDEDAWEATQLPIESSIADFANKIRELIANQDWEGLGEFLGKSINRVFNLAKAYLDSYELINAIDTITSVVATTLNSLVSAVDWELIGRTFGAGINRIIEAANQLMTKINWIEIGKAIADGLNGLISKIDWTGIGQFFSNKLNIIVDSVSGFVSNFNWEENASKFTKGLNAFVKNIHWSEAASAISNGLKGALSSIATIIEEFDWYDLGRKIATFISEIDWSGIISKVLEVVGAAIGGLGSFLIGLVSQAWEELVQWWNETAFEDGQFAIEGLLNGILEALKNIGTWIKENIFEPFIKGIKNAFKIGSPSKAMEELGPDIVDGLFIGIKNAWVNLKKKFKDLVDGLLDISFRTIEIVANVVKGTWVADAWEAVKTKTATITRFLQQSVQKGTSWVSEAWDAVKTRAATIVRTITQSVRKGSWITDAWTAVKTGTASVTRTLSQTVRKGTWVADAWSAVQLKAANLGRVLVQTVTKGRWIAEAWTAARTAGGIIYKTLRISVSWIGSKLSEAWRVITGRASGGVYSARIWRDIPQYAGGTIGTRGSMFVAGEAGPEVVGHLNGRTEVLNQSQLAATMYASVYSAMAAISKLVLAYLATAMFTSANAIIGAIQSFEVVLPTLIPNTISIPEIAKGYVVPSMAQVAAIQRSNELLAGAVDSLNQSSSDRLTNDELERIIERVIRRTLNIQFYIGDEQLARHANAGNDRLALRYNSAT